MANYSTNYEIAALRVVHVTSLFCSRIVLATRRIIASQALFSIIVIALHKQTRRSDTCFDFARLIALVQWPHLDISDTQGDRSGTTVSVLPFGFDFGLLGA